MPLAACSEENVLIVTVSAEHFSNAPPNVLIRLTHFFNAMLKQASMQACMIANEFK